MKGDRETWAELLPLIQAFVAGEAIQRKDYSGHWVDTDSMTSLLSDQGQYRRKPAAHVIGTWRRNFTYRQRGSVSGPTGSGVMEWKGADTDTPNWPDASDIAYTGEPFFVPDAEGVGSAQTDMSSREQAGMRLLQPS